MTNVTVVGISLPKQMLEQIDNERGDVPRSRFLCRILEAKYAPKEHVRI